MADPMISIILSDSNNKRVAGARVRVIYEAGRADEGVTDANGCVNLKYLGPFITSLIINQRWRPYRVELRDMDAVLNVRI
ncbi:hypothetical protein TFLX_05354 [Thermoflexales bacterium]|nr:hypothetical protein TFLX_05354 [Thermoflexales bacterium]